MKVLGFITEYNPFHFGHKYHLEESIRKTGASHTLAIMSSSFVQRGEPSIVDKWTKAKIAIENGVDLVIELPFIYSVQSAELFALGGIKTLDALNIVNYISFGSESGNLKPLLEIAKLLSHEPYEFRLKLKENLSLGLSFPSARSRAVCDYMKTNSSYNYDYEAILKQSNNILAIEYLKAIESLNSAIKPIAISRQGSDYKDATISGKYASATAIRRSILEKGLKSIDGLLPRPSYDHLLAFYNEYNKFNEIDNYYSVLKYLLYFKDKESIRKILDIEHGLENRLIEKSLVSTSVKEIIKNTSSKRYPMTRIQRILIHLLSGLSGETIKDLYTKDVPYIRFLGANEKGLELLNLIKERSDIYLLTKYSHHENLQDKLVNEFAHYEKIATNLYYFGLEAKGHHNMDYKTSPYIKK